MGKIDLRITLAALSLLAVLACCSVMGDSDRVVSFIVTNYPYTGYPGQQGIVFVSKNTSCYNALKTFAYSGTVAINRTNGNGEITWDSKATPPDGTWTMFINYKKAGVWDGIGAERKYHIEWTFRIKYDVQISNGIGIADWNDFINEFIYQ